VARVPAGAGPLSRRAPATPATPALVALAAVAVGACAPGSVADPPRDTPDVVLRLVAGDAQDARAANAALPASLVVASVDRTTGRVVPGVAVTWSTADGALSADTRTDARGEARAEWRLAARGGGAGAGGGPPPGGGGAPPPPPAGGPAPYFVQLVLMSFPHLR
jgi:hypothetical protein